MVCYSQETSPAPPIFGEDDWTAGFRDLPILVGKSMNSSLNLMKPC